MRTLHQMALALLIGALLIPTSSSIGTDVMTGGESIPLGPGDHCDILDADEDGVPLQGPPGLGRFDGWVDASGDEMCGELDMNDNFINFGGSSSQTDLPLSGGDGSGSSAAEANGAIAGGIRFGETELVSPAEGVLSFGGHTICLDAGNCDFSDVIIEQTLEVGGALSIGSGNGTDNDSIFFDDGISEFLRWNDALQRFELTDDLALNSGLVLEGLLLESVEGVLIFGGTPVCLAGSEISGCTTTDASTIDGLDSTQFLRSDVDDTFSGDLLTLTGDLHVAGTVTADDLVVSTKTRHLSLPPASFSAIVGGTDYFRGTTVLREDSVEADGRFLAPVHLPDGAVVTAVEANVHDSDTTENAQVRLVRNEGNNAATSMADVLTSGTPGDTTIIDTSVTAPTIDNDLNSYSVIVFLDASSVGDIKLYQVQITYTVTQPYP